MLNAAYIRALAARSGFDLCGIARSRTLDAERRRFERWRSAGYHDSLGYLERFDDRRFDPSVLFPGTRTVVVCALRCGEASPPPVASYALARDYHDVIGGLLREMLARLQRDHIVLNGKVCVDSAPVAEKSWAVEAGLGGIGRNSLLITPQAGSRVLLGELLLDMECDAYDAPYTEDPCGGCRTCVAACPAGAINPDRSIDLRRCISRRTIEKGAETPPEELHGWIFGCEECQSCCPRNRGAAANPLLAPVIEPSQDFWKGVTREQTAGTPLSRTGAETLRRRFEVREK